MSDDPFTMTSEQAGAELAKMSEAYRGPAPSATPQTSREAADRLNSLSSSKEWAAKFTSGDAATRAEFRQLTEQAARGDAADLAIETTVDGALPRAAYNSMIAGLREQGLPGASEEYIRELDAGKPVNLPTQGDAAACQQALDRLMKNAEWRRLVLAGDNRANAQRTELVSIIALANGTDGKPVSPHIAKALTAWGL